MTKETVEKPVFVSLREAARRTGMSKAILNRKIKNGEIPVGEKGADGGYRIDESKLLRLMDASRVQQATGSGGTVGTAAAAPETVRLALIEERKARELAEAKLALIEKQLEDMRADRDTWRQQAEQAMRLLPPRGKRRPWWRWIVAR